MAREATISQEEVNAVADSIRAVGIKPTARTVRDGLGRGSMGTVLKLLHVWQSSQARAPESPLTLPVALQRSLLDFIGQEVAAAKLSVEQELVSVQQAQKDLISENESLLGDLEELQVALEEVQVKHSQLEGRNAQLLADFADVTRVTETQRQAAESARTELAKLQLRLEGVPPLEAELSRIHAALEAERAVRVTADQAAAVAAARLEQSNALVDDLRVRLARAESDVREMHQEAAKLRNQVSSLQGSLDSTCKELTQTKEDARRAEAAATELKGRLVAAESSQQGSTKNLDNPKKV